MRGVREAHREHHWYRPSDRQIALQQLEDVVVPRPGRVAIFQHEIRHEGRPVVRGTKYAMRTDVVYEDGRA